MKQGSKRKRRIQYSIRTMLLIVTITAVGLGFYLHRINVESRAADFLSEHGCLPLERNDDFAMRAFAVSINGEIIGNTLPVRKSDVRRSVIDQINSYRYDHIYVTASSSLAPRELASNLNGLAWLKTVALHEGIYSSDEIEPIKSELPNVEFTTMEMLSVEPLAKPAVRTR